ncbi:PaaX family transcriptional regulator C-terminal domain-containing protein [Streptomyces sp. NPDC059832]|uniref:PaaX family transcriptional regulator C-terminal domain-containing protein n=1 Tax=Streptomyces sp. NPDC059832 TaxID=3346966 RepID=UPI00364F5DE4
MGEERGQALLRRATSGAELGLGDRIRAFRGEVAAPTEVGPLLRTAFDIDVIAEGYRDFLVRWGGGSAPGEAGDDLGRQLLLHTDWLDLVRRDPHLPAEHLPEEWPAARAEELFRELAHRFGPGASRIAHEILDRWDPSGSI